MLKSNKNILVLMTGSIACYKACGVISTLHQKGFNIKTVLSPSSLNFIGATTIEGLTGEPPISDMYASGRVMDHIHLARWADLILVAPATANYINKVAHGLGDDLLTTLFLAHDFKKPFLIAPAMNTMMYLHPITQNSLQKLKSFGVEILETASGILACGEVGYGRLLDPVLIVQEIEQRLSVVPAVQNIGKPKMSLKVLITSGGTSEPIDDVRVITNRSTGKTGAFLADQLIESGVEVDYLHAANAVQPYNHCNRFSFESFGQLQAQLNQLLPAKKYDYVIHLAAVSDYSVFKHEGKLSSDPSELTLKLTKNKKLINEIKRLSPETKLIGFKLTSEPDQNSVIEKVTELFRESNCDYIVQNDWSDIEKNTHSFKFFDATLKHESIKNVQELSFKIFQTMTEAL